MGGVRFQKRPEFVPIDLRRDWMLAAIVSCLAEGCKGQKCSQPRLQGLAWAILNPSNMLEVKHVFAKAGNPEETAVRFDASITRAIDLAVGVGLVELTSNSKIKLTEQGQALAAELASANAFTVEREFLREIRPLMTDGEFDQILEE